MTLAKISIQQNALQAAHDLRSPLTALKILAARTGVLPVEEMTKLLKLSVQQIESIITGLIQPQSEKKPAVLGLSEWFEIKQFELGNKVQFNLQCTSSVKLSTAIEMPLARVLSNLVNNAREAKATMITLKVTSNRSECLFEVKDNGEGFPKSVLHAFANGRFLSYGKANGHGLGLSSAAQYASQKGGKLEISYCGETCTSIRLPARRS